MKIFRKSFTVLVAIVCLACGIITYADSSFNPVYSRQLTSPNPDLYMYFSDSDARMHSVIYKSDAGFRFLTVSKPSYYYLTKDHLYAEYGEENNGEFTSSDGVFVSKVNKAIYIQTEDVKATIGFWGKVKSITVTYTGVDYTS